jgi:hypothetical protein
VRFAADHLSLRLAFLLLELRLLSADPSKSTNHRQSNCIFAQTDRRRDPHPPIRWVNARRGVQDAIDIIESLRQILSDGRFIESPYEIERDPAAVRRIKETVDELLLQTG